MLPLLAGKQALAEGVLDTAASLEEMPLPSGRAALVERLESLLESPPAESPPPKEKSGSVPSPAPELMDRATREAIERLAAARFLQLTPEGRRLLDQSSDRAPAPESERERRLRQARAVLAQAERKIRMASVLDLGGFPVEALPAARRWIRDATQLVERIEREVRAQGQDSEIRRLRQAGVRRSPGSSRLAPSLRRPA